MTEQDAADADDETSDAEDAAATDDETESWPVIGDRPDAEPDEELREAVSEADEDALAREIEALRDRVGSLEDDLSVAETELEEATAEVEDLESRLKRKQADFENYKKRTKERRERERTRAKADLLERLLEVRDNLVRALEQDEDADIRSGVESTLQRFDDVLDAEDVETAEPEPGSEVDPERHQVLARVDADQPEGTVADLHRPGYVMDETVLREAQVTVSEGSGDEGDDESEPNDEA